MLCTYLPLSSFENGPRHLALGVKRLEALGIPIRKSHKPALAPIRSEAQESSNHLTIVCNLAGNRSWVEEDCKFEKEDIEF
jgi:hypothetical protein